jgi:amino-acid N-acetyltransferase
MVYEGNYRQIRILREEDISELLGLIGRSVRRTHLVERSYEQIAESLEDYAVMEVDGHVVGCIALYSYGDIGEIACLYVKKTHESTGYGADLVSFMEKSAKQRGIHSVFALTNSAALFFTDKMNYQPVVVDTLPAERVKTLQNSGRNSQAFIKKI